MALIANLVRSLANRNYRLYFIGQSVSVLGVWMQTIAQSWLVYRLTDSSLMLAVVSFASQFPILILAPLGGVVADRFPRRTTVVLTQAASMILASVLGVLTLLGRIEAWEVVFFAGLFGVVSSFDVPARTALVTDLVPPEDMLNAISLDAAAFNRAGTFGPVVAGFVLAAYGEAWCFLFNASSYIAPIISLLLMRLPKSRPGEPREAQTTGIREVLRFIEEARPMRKLLWGLGVVSLLGLPFTVLMPMVVGDILHQGADSLGVLMSACGIGAYVATIFLAARKQLFGLGRLIVTSCAGLGMGLILFSLSQSFFLSLAILVPVGFCMFVVVTGTNSLVLAMSPKALRGRTIAFYSMLLLGAAPVGSLLFALVAKYLGVLTTIGLGGGACLIVASLVTRDLQAVILEGRHLLEAHFMPAQAMASAHEVPLTAAELVKEQN